MRRRRSGWERRFWEGDQPRGARGGVGGHPQHRLGRSQAGPSRGNSAAITGMWGSYRVNQRADVHNCIQFLFLTYLCIRAERGSDLSCLCCSGVSKPILFFLLAGGGCRGSPKRKTENEHSRCVHTGQRSCRWHRWCEGTALLTPGCSDDKEPLDGDATYSHPDSPPAHLQKPHQLTTGMDTRQPITALSRAASPPPQPCRGPQPRCQGCTKHRAVNWFCFGKRE